MIQSVDTGVVEAAAERLVVLVVANGPRAQEVYDDVASVIDEHEVEAEMVLVKNADQAVRWMRTAPVQEDLPEHLEDAPLDVSLVVHLAGDDRGDDLLQQVASTKGGENAQYFLVTDRSEHDDMSWIIDQDRLVGILSLPLSEFRLEKIVRYHLKRHYEDVDWYRRRRKVQPATGSKEARAQPQKPPVTPETVKSRLLENLSMSTNDAVASLVEAIEQIIGPRPRIHVPPGVRITHEDDEMHAVMLVLRGAVSMTVESRAGEVILHHASTGPVVGLLSLADRKRSFVTARTTTECVVVHLSTQQLDRALERSPEVGAALTAVSIRVLSTRLRRAQRLHVEKYELAAELDREREHLAEALTALENARTQLIAQARFATLGELSAGIAHELNNPIGAMSRAGEHLQADVERLIQTHPRRDVLMAAIENARTARRGSAAEQRVWRREVESVIKDPDLARRLVAAGVRDKASAKAARKHVDLVEIAAGIGTSLRNLQQGGEHVAGLVDSLRSHARPDATELVEVDVVASLEQAVRLTGHRLNDIEVNIEAAPDLPIVAGHPGRFGQVWTNLLVNAADAMVDTPEPSILIRVNTIGTPGTDEAVRVEVIDNGPGISEENQEHIFQPRFTTKHGTVRYGLGMGLGISRRIIEDLGGTLDAESVPGQTTFITVLPVEPPAPDDEGEILGELPLVSSPSTATNPN